MDLFDEAVNAGGHILLRVALLTTVYLQRVPLGVGRLNWLLLRKDNVGEDPLLCSGALPNVLSVSVCEGAVNCLAQSQVAVSRPLPSPEGCG